MQTLNILKHLNAESKRLLSTSADCFENWEKAQCSTQKEEWWNLGCLYSTEGEKVKEALSLIAECWALD